MYEETSGTGQAVDITHLPAQPAELPNQTENS